MSIKITKNLNVRVSLVFEGKEESFTAQCRRIKIKDFSKFTGGDEESVRDLSRISDFIDEILVGCKGLDLVDDNDQPADRAEVREFLINDLQFAKAIQDAYVNVMLGLHEKNSEKPLEA